MKDYPTHTWKKPPIRTLYSVCTVVLIGRFWSMIAKLFKQKGGTKIPRLGSGLWVYDTILNNIKWLTMFFKTRWRFSAISHRRVKPLRWKMTEKRPRVLKNIFNYFIAMILQYVYRCTSITNGRSGFLRVLTGLRLGIYRVNELSLFCLFSLWCLKPIYFISRNDSNYR
jgi:hypothetical protein